MPSGRAAPGKERTVRMAEVAASGKTWCPKGFATIDEALAQIDLGIDERLDEKVRAAIQRLTARREQMPDDLGELEDAIVREVTRDGHGELDAIAAAPVLANLLELDLNQRGYGNREVIPDDMSLSDALDYAFDVSLLMKLHGHSRELVAYLALSSLATEYHVEVVSPAMVNLAWNALPQDRSWDDGVSVSQCLSELWERARQTNEELLARRLGTQLAQAVVFGDGISLYVNEEGIGTCPPNRAVYATRGMEREGYLSQMDFATPVREGDLYGLLFGDIVAVGFDAMEGTNRSLTDDELARVSEYFSGVSRPGSGLAEVIAIRHDGRADDLGRESRPEPIRMAVLAGYDLASESRDMTAASEELDASGHGIDAPERDDDM